MLQLCIPKVHGWHGGGLGNEMVAWAKGIIASHELGLRLLHPAWGLNRRGYRHYFRTGRTDWLYQRALMHALPTFAFTENDYWRHGGRDFGEAIRSYAEEKELRSRGVFVLTVEGMWGGFRALANARALILAELYRTRWTGSNFYQLQTRLPRNCLIAGVHIRRGDFAAAPESGAYRGAFNVALPEQWYIETCRKLRNAFGDRIQFLLVTDAGPSELTQFRTEFAPVTTADQHHSDISDLLALAATDIQVCSVSSYSMWAAFFSQKPYIWFKPELFEDGGGYTVWGATAHPATTNAVNQLRANPQQHAPNPRGVPLGLGEELPPALIENLGCALAMKNEDRDLLLGGALPVR